MKIIDGIAVFGDADENTLAQAKDVRTRAEHVALMGDNHLGYIMPVGGVAAYRNKVSVSGVGYDIACGNCAIKTDMHIEDISEGRHCEEIADDIASHVSFGMGRSNKADDAPTDHPLFDSPVWAGLGVLAGRQTADSLKDKARNQLGTVGSGNHYVDVFADEEGWIWVGVHFGSRGLGHSIATGFMNKFHAGKWDGRVPEQETLLDLDSALGGAYWALMELAGQYAYAGREWVARKVVNLLGAGEVEMVHNHHNFAWRERHLIGDSWEDVVVVRKGATPAFPDQRGFVGGSMGDNAVILEGSPMNFVDIPYLGFEPVPTAEQAASLFSTVHGAGRVMSRTQAAGKRNRKTGEQITQGAISREEMDAWVNNAGVILRGAGRDEAPQAYRRLPDVLAAQGDTIKVLHTLRPLIVVMAGADEFDPYKD